MRQRPDLRDAASTCARGASRLLPGPRRRSAAALPRSVSLLASRLGDGLGHGEGGTLAARAPPARAFAGARHQHAVSHLVARILERRPPLADFGIELAALAAQQQKIVAGAKPLVLEQRQRAPAAALRSAAAGATAPSSCASKRRGMASCPRCASSTSSMASCSAGMRVHRPRPGAPSSAASTSCHSSAANRNAGETGLSARIRSSVLAQREHHEALAQWAARGSRRASAAGRDAAPARAAADTHATAWPDSSSFSISSNRRAAGTFCSRSARACGSALRVAGLDREPELRRQAAPRAACAPGPRGSARPGRRSSQHAFLCRSATPPQ